MADVDRYFEQCRVWITGASSGIGQALALELLRRGARVAISARNGTALRAMELTWGSERVLPLPIDVTRREANQQAATSIQTQFGGLDLTVFNAGTCEYVDARNFDSAVFARTFETNYVSMMHGIEAALPLLRASARPHLAGMSSAVALGPLPRAEAYGASKAAIRYTLGALRISLRRDKIPVSVICPGFVRTPLTDRNDFAMPFRVEPEEAAQIIADGLARQRREIHFPSRFTLPYRLLSLLPGSIYDHLIAKAVAR